MILLSDEASQREEQWDVKRLKGERFLLEFFPDPYPDEILYSVWARYSDHVGYSYKADVLLELFGDRYLRPVLDLPCRLQSFVDNLPFGHDYDVNYFIDHHTLLPFYGAFLPSERLQYVREQMACGPGKLLHRHVGIDMRIMSPVWLRYCPECARKERKEFGECFWHRLHQIPGVEVCPVHGMFLENSSVHLSNTSLYHRGLFSAERTVSEVSARDASSSPFFQSFMSIAQDSSYLLEHPHLLFDTAVASSRYCVALAHQGLLTPRGKTRLHDLFIAFTAFYSQELLNFLHCEVKVSGQLDSEWLARIVRPRIEERKRVHHPLYHILLIRFLGSPLETFMSQDIPFPLPFGSGPWPCLNPVCEYYMRPLIQTYQISETRIKGKIVGVFSCHCGYTYSRTGPDTSSEDVFHKGRVLSYGQVWDAKFRELWYDPAVSIMKIAGLVGLQRTLLNRHARRLQLPVPRFPSHRILKKESQPGTTEKNREWYRTQWLALIADAPEEVQHQLVRRAKGVHKWLFRHDREWLRANSRSKGRQSENDTHTQTLEKDWRLRPDRDALMAESVRTVAKNLGNEQGYPKRVSKRAICREIPELRWVPTTKSAPLTALALEEVAESFEDFALRRIHWAQQQYLQEGICPTRNIFIKRSHITKMLSVEKIQSALDEAMDLLSSMKNLY